MISRDNIIKQIKGNIEFLEKELKENYHRNTEVSLNDNKETLELLNKHIEEPEEKFYVAHHTDYRMLGDDHSEVSYTIQFICCKNCARAVHKEYSKRSKAFGGSRNGYYYSFGSVDKNIKVNGEVGQKIVKIPSRSYQESLESDEMRISRGTWLD